MKKPAYRILSAAAAAVMAATPFAAYAEGDISDIHTAQSSVAEGISEGGIKGAEYTSVLYDSYNGLPTSEANTVLQTTDGFIWIGSYSGLIRYDGSNFHRYDDEGISSVVTLFEDSHDRLWIGTNDGGVAVMENNRFMIYDQHQGLPTSAIRNISEDSAGNIIVATNFGLSYIDPDGNLHISDDPQIAAKNIIELRAAEDGTVYGITKDNLIFTINDLRITSFYSGDNLGFDTVNCIAPDPENDGFAYMGTIHSDLIYGDIKNGMDNITAIDVSPLVNINKIFPLNSQIWLCADNGIGFVDPDGNFSVIADVPMNNSIDDMAADSEGNLWFASSRQGVMKICHNDFVDISVAAELADMVVNAVHLRGSELYIGSDTGLHVLELPGYNEKTTEISGLLAHERIRCIKEDSKGNLWFSTYAGLFCLKPDGSIDSFGDGKGFATNKVRVTEELSDGRIAVSTSAGVYFIDNGLVAENISAANGLSERDILTICEGDNGEIYLGSDGNGIYILKNNSVVRMGKFDGLMSEVILRIKKEESTGIYWIVTSNSLAYMIDGVINTVTGFPYSNNFDIFFDGNGGAWILSSNGIYITRTERLLNGTANAEYTFLGTASGLPSVATANSRSCLTPDGRLYIAGSKGVSMIDINGAVENGQDIMLTIPFIEVDNGNGTEFISLRGKSSITVPSDNMRVTIYGYALTYSLRDPRMQYMLHGFDNQPYAVMRSDMQPVTYTNLDGGTYRFELSVLNTRTGLTDKTVSLTITKELAFHEQFWFRVVLIVAGGIVLFLIIDFIYRRREAALVKEQEKKQVMIDELTEVFAKCVDMKDEYTNGHSVRVAEYSRLLAKKLGKSEKEQHDIYNAAMLHDIGKIGIPDAVLNKNGRPTDEEYEQLKSHTTLGHDVLSQITIAPELSYGAWYHHERIDGRGYPRGLKGDQIPELGQIIAVADTFDAMYSTRAYRRQMDINDVLNELKRVSGTQLNGEIVAKLEELIDEGEIKQKEL